MKSYLTKPDGCLTCPHSFHSEGFVLGCGDPRTAKLALLLETPWKEEISFQLISGKRWFYSTDELCEREIALRRRDYPSITNGNVGRGVPVVGATGMELVGWVLPRFGWTRYDLFIDNVLRCAMLEGKDEEKYPTGDMRKAAEAHCRQWDRWFGPNGFNPTVAIVSIHPAAITREVTPLPLQIRTFERAAKLIAQGERPILLCGGKAAKWWLNYAENVFRWAGHYQFENEMTVASRERRREEGLGIVIDQTTGKKAKKPKLSKWERFVAGEDIKLSAKDAIGHVLAACQPENLPDGVYGRLVKLFS